MVDNRWEHFHHESDIGVRGIGENADRAFEQAALALTAVITEKEVRAETSATFSLQSQDLEYLFVDWLNALIYEMATGGRLFGRFEVRITGTRLEARAWGEPVDVERHEPAVEIKGATLSELKVEQISGGGWSAQCVVDV